MTESYVLVNMYNPGQVLACLGFMEAANELCGDVWSMFDWSNEANVKFHLKTEGTENPFVAALDFVANAEIREIVPFGTNSGHKERMHSTEYPESLPKSDRARPIELIDQSNCIVLSHWADGSDRNKFKLYAGNRSAFGISRNNVQKSLSELWAKNRSSLIKTPFDVLMPTGGSFNFDPRGAWVPINVGYSPNQHKNYCVDSSPVVEIFAAWGLENSRLDEYEPQKVRYTTWGVDLPISMARIAMTNHISKLINPQHHKQFSFEMLGNYNKVFTLAQLEVH